VKSYRRREKGKEKREPDVTLVGENDSQILTTRGRRRHRKGEEEGDDPSPLKKNGWNSNWRERKEGGRQAEVTVPGGKKRGGGEKGKGGILL